MGNTFGRRKTIKIMKIDSETIKLKTPVKVGEVLKDYQGYVLFESESVKQYGIRSKPLESQQTLEPKKLYFLVELPKVNVESLPRRVRSGINMSAKDRLESLKLARRSSSDLSFMRPRSMIAEESVDYQQGGVMTERSGKRVTMRVPKAMVARLMEESKDEAEAAKKIMDLYTGKTCDDSGRKGDRGDEYKGKEHQQEKWRSGYKKKVSFLTSNEGEIQVAVASY